MNSEFLEQLLNLLLDGAPREEIDRLAAQDRDPDAARIHAQVVRLHDHMRQQLGREAELSALNETARDLTAIRDLDQILAAIVRRARSLLGADMTYLSLNDEPEGASYMKVTDGALTPEFQQLRLPLGTGLLGLVAQSGAPYFTEDYQADSRFVHREYIDSAVAGEHIRAILGVPLEVDGKVIGALLAVHRRVRRFPPGEVALLTSFAAHAAVALQNARLFDDLARANEELVTRSSATEHAATVHDALTDVLLHAGSVRDVARVIGAALSGEVEVYDASGRALTESGQALDVDFDLAHARQSGRAFKTPSGTWLAVAAAGEEHLATLAVDTTTDLQLPEQRTLERGAMVTALVLLFQRSVADAEGRVRGELVTDLLSGDHDPQLLIERARQRGMDLDGPLVVMAVDLGSADRQSAARTATALATEAAGLSGWSGDRLVVLLPVTSSSPDHLAHATQLRQRLGAGTVGVVQNHEGVAGIRAAAQEACRCIDALLALGRAGSVSDPAHLGVTRLLLGTSSVAELGDFISTTIGPVVDYDADRGTALIETLQAWFDSGGVAGGTAERLHLHPNTVAQRLDRVSSLLGSDWRKNSLDIQLALRAHTLRDM